MTQIISGTSAIKNNVLSFAIKSKSKLKSNNSKSGESQEVYPFKNINDINNVSSYLKTKNIRDYTIFIVGINTGLRCGDLLSLSWEKVLNNISGNINDSVTIFEEKTNKKRNIEFNDLVLTLLTDYYLHEYYRLGTAPTGYLFKSKRANSEGINCVGVDHVRKMLKEAALACDITFNVGTHSMRKTWGYHFFQTLTQNGNVDAIYMLQEFFNHSSVKVTKAYIGLQKEIERSMYQKIQLGN